MPSGSTKEEDSLRSASTAAQAHGSARVGALVRTGALVVATALVTAGVLTIAQTRGKEAQANRQEAKDQWTEEILLELSEIRHAQGELVKQVTAVQTQVTALGTAGAGGGAEVAVAASPFDLRDATLPVLGDVDAQVAIVEFSDFQCPYCRRHQTNTTPALVDKYVQTGKVKYVFVDFPLSFHDNAESAAVAAACADKQGSFWRMHDALFASQAALGAETYRKLAADLNLDKAAFERCLSDPATVANVTKHVALGESMGVTGTPSFLVGRVRDGKLVDGISVSGAQPLSSFERVLAPLLESVAAR